MRRIVGILSTLTTVAAGIVLAAPVQAADLTIACTDSVGSSVTATGSTYTISAGTDCTHVIWSYTTGSSGFAVSILPSTSVPEGVETSFTPTKDIEILKSGSATALTITLADGPFGFSTFSKNIVVSFTGGGGGSGSSSSSATPAPALETLTLEVSTGNTTCTGGSPTGYSGSWLQLPAADACSQSGPNANPDAKLLGWATSSNFPIELAQRQVNNGWGAYETFNDDGQLTGVFIPAGGWTFVSASGNLYPIWSS